MTQRSTTVRDRHRNLIRRERPPCGLCGGDIDYDLPHTDPMSFVVDHVIPLSVSHDDTIENKQAAHRKCNRDKSDKLEPTIRTFVTHREW